MCVSGSPREFGDDALTIMGGPPWQEVQPTHTTGTLLPGWLKIDWLELVSQAASFTNGEKWLSLAAEKLESAGGVSQASAAQVTQALVKTFLDPRHCPCAIHQGSEDWERGPGNPVLNEQCVYSRSFLTRQV